MVGYKADDPEATSGEKDYWARKRNQRLFDKMEDEHLIKMFEEAENETERESVREQMRAANLRRIDRELRESERPRW